MKILFMDWASFAKEDMVGALESLGYEVERIQFDYKNDADDLIYEEKLHKLLSFQYYDLVFSANYYPIIAEACEACRITYISWIYDSPLLCLKHKSVFYSCNQIFTFDQSMVKEYRAMGVKNIHYMPLGVNTKRLDGIVITPSEEEEFRSDVSFVGNIYDKEDDFIGRESELKGYSKGYIEAIVRAQMEIQGYNFLEELLGQDVMEQLNILFCYEKKEGGLETPEYVYSNYYLARKVTSLERKTIIKKVSEQYDLDLYTSADKALFPRANYRGTVDYYLTMPKVFRLSRINLNITLRSIKTGIPLRAWDIMGSGGFLLTNYQEDFLQHFEPGIDYVYYEDQDDLIRKIGYYLNHEEERRAIAQNGYEKVKEYYSYETLLEQMFCIAGIKKQN